MAQEVKVPPMGESISEATVAGWRRQPGEGVRSGDILVELETDKVTMEVPSPVDGTLTEIRHKSGDTVHPDDVLAIVEPGAATGAIPVKTTQPAPPSDTQPRNETLPPGARRLAEEANIDLSQIQGTGKRGQVTKSDVVTHMEKQESTGRTSAAPKQAPTSSPTRTGTEAPTIPSPGQTGSEERVPMSRLRLRIAERLVQAQHSAAILTTFNEVDMSALMEIRNRFRDSFEKRHGAKLGFMSFFAKACVAALKEFPAVNAEIDGQDLVYKYHYDIGVAVGGPRGLVVPVIRNCDSLSMAGIEQEIARLAQKVREGTITLEEMSGGTFTISNGGIYGSMMSTPILNPPQSGILGMHNITKRAVVVNDEIVIRPMMYLALSYDHRIIDGKEAVSFLVRVKEYVESPERMLLEA